MIACNFGETLPDALLIVLDFSLIYMTEYMTEYMTDHMTEQTEIDQERQGRVQSGGAHNGGTDKTKCALCFLG